MITTKKRNWWAIITMICLASAIIWCLLGVFSMVLGFYTDWSDNLDSYVDESDLNGQGAWISPKDVKVSNDQAYSAPNGIKRGSQNDPFFDARGSALNSGILSFKFYNTSTADGYATLFLTAPNGSTSIPTFYFIESGATFNVYYGGGYPSGTLYTTGLAMNTWHTAYVEWDTETDLARIKINELDYSAWFTLATGAGDEVGGFSIRLGYADNVYFDDFLVESVEPPPLDPRVWGIDPVSETEITDLNTSFEFGWEDLDDWDTLWLNFQNRPTGIFTQGQEILITTSPSGSAVFNLTDFNFDRYGTFYFHAVAGKEVMEVIEGMFITGKYISEWTGDLVSPEYDLILTTTTGLAPIFEMSDFLAWYSANAKFPTPTNMFSAIAGFFDPIFNKIGEFGNRIKDYFNVNEAYGQGYEIGKSVPYFTYFVGQVSLFLGGFPIMKWLFVIVLLLTGIFIFRLIMKFIPFLGN